MLPPVGRVFDGCIDVVLQPHRGAGGPDADLERRLRDAERRLMTPRAAGWALPEPAREPADRPLAGSASADGERVEATAASASAAWSAEPATMPPLFRDAATLPRRFAEPPPHPDGDAEIEPGGVEIEPRDRDAAREAAWAPPALVVEEPHRPARATQPEPRPAGWQAIGTAWEAGVGGSVLAKLGAVLVVIGVALFVGWSMMHLGPTGRVAIALALSGTLLAAGLAFQRWPEYRSLALGLSAAGWGGLYVTAYAMHGLEAARVIQDPLAAFALLLAVAAGMIAHALWLGLPALVAAAYAAAFTAVVLGPASVPAAVACVTLTATLLAVAARHDWPGFAVAGVVCTYGILAFRSPPAEAVAGLGGLTAAHALLWVSWLLFESFDILMAARGRGGADAGRAVMLLNLCGLLGVSLLLWPPQAAGLDAFCATTALAYGASTLCRVFVTRRPSVAASESEVDGGGYEATTTIATVLCAVALGLRYTAGWRLHVGLLLEAEFLFLLGVVFGRRYLRLLAAGVFAVALVRFVALDVPPGHEVAMRLVTVMSWTPSALLAAAVLVINRAVLARTSSRPLLAAEHASTYVAAGLVTLVIGGEVWYGHNGLAAEMLGVAWLVLAWILLQIAIRWRFADAYRQCCLVAFAALVPLVGVNAVPLVPVADAAAPVRIWIWLLPAVAILHALAWQMRAEDWLAAAAPPAADVAGMGLLAASGLTLVLLWHALPAPLVALGWAAYAVLAFRLGLRVQDAGLRWHAYGALALAVGRLFLANFTTAGMTGFVSHRVLTVVPVILVLYDVAARLTDRRPRPRIAAGERLIGGVCCWTGTAVLVVLLRFELGRVLAVVGWAILGLVLLALGRRRAAAHLRWQSHAIALLTFARSWGTQLYVPESPGGVLHPGVLGSLVVASLFASELLCPPAGRVRRPLAGVSRLLGWLDAHRRSYYAALGTVLLAALLLHQLPARLLTAALGVEGATLLVLGFLRPDRSLRTCGLGVLGICVVKLFFWDLRHLETPYRILSFVLLGMLLLAASWCYARFKHRLQAIP